MNQIISPQDQAPTPPQQMALDIFGLMDPSDTSITEAGKDFHLKKSSILIDVSDVGLLARRVLNGAYFLAQGNPDAETHTFELRFFKWLINYGNSNNSTHLKRVIREAQKSAVQVNVISADNQEDDNWMSVPMLGAAAIKDGKIMFKIPVELRRQIADPERHAYLSMRILMGFSSGNAMTLYEQLSVYKGEGQTPWWTIEEFRSMLKVDGLKSANDFRYFRRDILEPAIEQINKISEIDVALKLKRTGRSYSHLSFTVKESRGTALLSSIDASKELFEILVKEFGLSDADLDEIEVNRGDWSDTRIRDAVELVRSRCQDSTVQYPGKYLMKAIRDGYRVGSIEKAKQETKKASDKKKERAAKAIEEVRNKDIKVPSAETMSDSDRDQAWRAFARSPQAKLHKKLPESYDLATAPQKRTFDGFLATNFTNT